MDSLNGDFETLVANLHLLLHGRVLDWYWTISRQNPFPSWENVKYALRADWGEHSNDVDILRRLLARKQRADEPFASYYQDIFRLRTFLNSPMGEMEFIETVRSNLLPSIQKQLCAHHITSIAQLRALVQSIQTTDARIRSHAPSYARSQPRLEAHRALDYTVDRVPTYEVEDAAREIRTTNQPLWRQ